MDAYLFHALLVDNDPRKFGILSFFGIHPLDSGGETFLVLALLLLLADPFAGPVTPAGQSVVNHLVTLIFDGVMLFLLEFLYDLVPRECSLHEVVVLEKHWYLLFVIAFV